MSNPTSNDTNGRLRRTLLATAVAAFLAASGWLSVQVWAHEGRICQAESQVELLNLKVDLLLDHFGITKPEKENP